MYATNHKTWCKKELPNLQKILFNTKYCVPIDPYYRRWTGKNMNWRHAKLGNPGPIYEDPCKPAWASGISGLPQPPLVVKVTWLVGCFSLAGLSSIQWRHKLVDEIFSASMLYVMKFRTDISWCLTEWLMCDKILRCRANLDRTSGGFEKGDNNVVEIWIAD